MATQLIGGTPDSAFSARRSSILSDYRTEIIGAIDMLITGV